MIGLRAVVLHCVRDMRVEDVKEPEVMDGDVLIRVRAASVCGTDAHLYGGELEVEPPMILGHDFLGVGERMGSGVEDFSSGERVITEIARYDDTCHFCRTGRVPPLHQLPLHGVRRRQGRRQALTR